MKSRKYNPIWSFAAVAVLGTGVVFVQGCSKAAETVAGSSTDLTLSGQLSTTGTGARVRLDQDSSSARSSLLPGDLGAISSSADGLIVYCVTLSVPPAAGSGTVSGGAFTLTVAAAKGKKLGCFVMDSSEEVLGTMVFDDGSSGLGDSSGSDKAAFASSSNLGAIVLDLDTGTAAVDLTQAVPTDGGTSVIAEAPVLATTEAFNMTGKWNIAAISDFTVPTGYRNATSIAECEAIQAANPNNGGGGCGPLVGMQLYWQRLDGHAYSGGTTDSSTPKYGVMMWMNENSIGESGGHIVIDNATSGKESDAGFIGCGNKTGFENQEAKDHVGIDFDALSGVSIGKFSYLTEIAVTGMTGSSNGNPAVADGWKVEGATAPYGIQDCEMGDYNGRRVMVCYDGRDHTTANRQYNIENKCVLSSDGSNVNPQSWPQQVCTTSTNGSNTGSSENYSCGAPNSDGISTCICPNDGNGVVTHTGFNTTTGESYWDSVGNASVNGSSVSVKCSNKQALRTAAGAVITNNSTFDWNGAQLAAKGASCGNYSGTLNLQQLQCFAQFYYNNRAAFEAAGGCQRELRTNWGAQSADQFVEEGHTKARGLNILAELKYSDADTASAFNDEFEMRYEDNNLTCPIQRQESIGFTKVSSTKILVTYQESQRNADPSNLACAAKYGAGKTEKFMFYMDKQ